jgi:hypothetical protein
MLAPFNAYKLRIGRRLFFPKNQEAVKGSKCDILVTRG